MKRHTKYPYVVTVVGSFLIAGSISGCSSINQVISQSISEETCQTLNSIKEPVDSLALRSPNLTAGQALKIVNAIEVIFNIQKSVQDTTLLDSINPLTATFHDQLLALQEKLETVDPNSPVQDVIPGFETSVSILASTYRSAMALTTCQV